MVLVSVVAQASAQPPGDEIGPMSQWRGLVHDPADTSSGRLAIPGEASFDFSPPRDWRQYSAVCLRSRRAEPGTYELEVIAEFDYAPQLALGRSETIFFPPDARSRVALAGGDWRDVVLPLASFEALRDQPGMWQFVKRIRVRAAADADATGAIEIGRVTISRASAIELLTDRRSRAAEVGQSAVYPLRVRNHGSRPQTVRLLLERRERDHGTLAVQPQIVQIEPGGEASVKVTIPVSNEIPVAGRLTRRLTAVANGDGEHVAQLDLTAVRQKPRPYLLLTEDGWSDVRRKIDRCAWASRARDGIVERARQWQPPPFSDRKITVYDGWEQMVPLVDVAIAWKLTADPQFRDKIITVLRQMTDPARGYLAKGNAVTTDGIGVHEGMFFTYFTTAYDLVFDDPSLQAADHAALEQILIRYLDETEQFLDHQLVYNYSTCANVGGILAALVLQDVQRLDRQLYGRGGLAFQIGAGVQDDGWHMEGATNYHVLIMRYYAAAIAACDNWGINLYDARFPTFPSKLIHQGTAFQGYLGMDFEKWGPVGRNYRSWRDMLDGLIPMMDANRTVLANNDSEPQPVRDVFEQAYAHWRDPTYAWVVGHGDRAGYASKDDYASTGWRHLLYGVEDVPVVKDPRGNSACVPNAGLAALRSQTANRSPDEQIMAVIKWGTHGGWHGHFDRVSLLGLVRYNQHICAPFAGFDGYMTEQYKMWDQASASHNMVVVDQRMQEPVESKLLVFASDPILQLCVAETVARWSDVPDWMQLYPPKTTETGVHFAVDAKPVVQRRLLAVTDDYVLIMDHVRAEEPHTLDWLIHLYGFESLSDASKPPIRQASQADSQRVSSYRFMTNCKWYMLDAPVTARFQHDSVNTDVQLLWPSRIELMLGDVPSGRANAKANERRRNVLLARSKGPVGRFIAILEPRRGRSMIERALAVNPDQILVTLTDGRQHEITVDGFEGDGMGIRLTLREKRDQATIRECELPSTPAK